MEIRSFRGYRYNAERVGSLSRVVSAPYDQYDAESQAAAYKQSPHHFVRVILPRDEAPHAAAARTLNAWIDDGVLMGEPAPAVYPYSQTYRLPGGEERTRHGFLALVRLTALSGGPIHPHERTLPKPLGDRLELLRRTRADLGPVFITFADDGGAVSAHLSPVHARDPEVEVRDGDGNRHCMWVETDEAWQQKLAALVAKADGIIADGHHRYKAALQYAEEQRAAGVDADHPSQFKLVAMFPAFEDNVSVLPIHRVVQHWPEDTDPERFFRVESVNHLRLEDVVDVVTRRPGTLGMFSREEGVQVWSYRADAPLPWMAGSTAAYRLLPAALFELSVLQGLLGMTPDDIAAKKGLAFVKKTADATKLLWGGYARAFFLPPTPLDAVIATARAGELMPQKSTYFYPKLLSGLVSHLHGR